MKARVGLQAGVLGFALAAAAMPATAMVELADDALSDATGDGLTFVWTDFRMLFHPESYFEQVGSAGSNTCTGTGNTSGNFNCWRRGDLRWYGLNSSAEGTAVGQTLTGGVWNTTWTTTAGNMTQCADAGVAGLGCPRGGPIALFAAHDNPYILRVSQYTGDNTANNVIGNGIVTYQGSTSSANWPTGATQTVLEWLAPTSQDEYRVSFWGELEVGRGGTGTGLLKSQTIISGNAAKSQFRFWKFTQTSTSPGAAAAYNPLLGAAGCTDAGCAGVDGAGSTYNNRTMTIDYISWLRGDFRFSVAQTENTPVIGVPVVFHATEGMYFRNAEVFVPLGQPFYQAMNLNVPRNTGTNAAITDGNITLEIPILPNRTAVWTRFYSLNTSPAVGGASVRNSYDYGYATARSAWLRKLAPNTAAYMPDADITTAPFPADYPAPNANYDKTHGFVRWGDWSMCTGRNCIVPSTANTVAQADQGIGRNSWRSDGDGTFFKNIASYTAYSYRPFTVDVSTDPGVADPVNSDAYTSFRYMRNDGQSLSCNSAGSALNCGYGGSYLGTNSFGVNPVTSVSILPVENFWNKNPVGGNDFRNVVVVPANSTLNLGDSRLEGMAIQYLRLQTYGSTF